MEKVIVNVAWCDRNYGGSLGSNVPGAVVFTAPTFEVLQKEAKESLEFHVGGLVELVKTLRMMDIQSLI